VNVFVAWKCTTFWREISRFEKSSVPRGIFGGATILVNVARLRTDDSEKVRRYGHPIQAVGGSFSAPSHT
jgi:hypothetical protein